MMKRVVHFLGSRLTDFVAQKLDGLLRDKRGMGAVEFAILVPILLVTYIGVFELTVGFSTAKRVTRSVGAIADFVTQKPTTSDDELSDMIHVARSYIAPYKTDGITIKINGIAIDSARSATIAWSWADGTTKSVVGDAVAVPEPILKAESYLVQVEVSIPHELLMFMPTIAWQSKTFPITRTNFFSPRIGKSVICADC